MTRPLQACNGLPDFHQTIVADMNSIYLWVTAAQLGILTPSGRIAQQTVMNMSERNAVRYGQQRNAAQPKVSPGQALIFDEAEIGVQR